MDSIKILLIVLIGIIIVYGIISFTMSIISSEMCKKECLLKGTIFYERINSGNLAIDDMCICYLENGEIETVRLGR